MTRDLTDQVQKAFRRLENLSQYDSPSKEQTSKLISELNSALHELQSTTAELQAQNEEMASNRRILEEANVRYQELFEFAPDGYLVTDTEGILIEANDSAAKLFNVSKSMLIGKPLALFVCEEKRPSFRARIADIKKSTLDQNVNWELEMVSANRTSFPVSITTEKVFSSKGGNTELRWLLRDITENRKVEEELQKADKLDSIGVLAGGIAHDLNNFLTIILGNLTLLKRYIKNDENAEDNKTAIFVRNIEEAVGQTRDLTCQLLTFAKGGNPLTKAVSIATLIKEDSAFALSGSKLRCDLFLPEDLPAVEVDRGQITQVITNLLINADQAMPEGGTIRIRAERQFVDGEDGKMPLQPGNYIALTITDEGAGIPSEVLPKIFDPYYTTKKHGNGLGLAICYSIVKKHGGHISVQSIVDIGTSFTVYLPVSRVQVESETDENTLIMGAGRVLLMEDEEKVRNTAYEMLTFLGYDVALAEDGTQAIRLYKEAFLSGQPFDVVIADLTVRGGMGGKKAVDELIKIDPNMKAIVSSGYSSDALANYKKYGFCDVIAKPYRLHELGKVISDVIQSKENERKNGLR